MPHSPPDVLSVTWNWRQRSRTVRSAGPNLRRAAVVQAVVMGAVAAGLYFWLGHHLAGRIVGGLAVLVLGLGLLAPAAYRPVHGFGQTLGRLVGTALVYLLLVPFFFLFFLPVALWLRLRGRDPLHRKLRDERWTYWIARRPRPRDQNIAKQFLREDRAARGALRDVGSLPEDRA